MRNLFNRGLVPVIAAAILVFAPGLGVNNGSAEARDRDASIAFANSTGIRNWRADGHDAIYVQSRNRQWYRATFYGSCLELPWHQAVAFITEPGGQLNRYSAIVVGGERCSFRTFERSAAPPKHRKALKQTDAQLP